MMKNILIALVIAITTLSLGLSDAQARRMGGGGSFGKQSHNFNRQAPSRNNQMANPSKQASPAGAAKPASPWRGMLGGALLGLGLGALLSHFGIGGALASMVSTLLMLGLLAMAVVFVVRMFRRNNAAQSERPAYAGAVSATPQIGSRLEQTQPFAYSDAAAVTSASNGLIVLPPDFDEIAFLRIAKTHFIRLQAAWDKADTDDIHAFTTPEIYAEMKLQLHERGTSTNHTDVVSLDAELLGVELIANEYLASVKFSGVIKEAVDATAEPFSEIWNLAKPVADGSGWLLAGIQQI